MPTDKQQGRVATFEKRLSQLDSDLDRLRALYDQYFVGIEKREPLTIRNRIGRLIRDERVDRDMTTVQRFKFRTLSHKFSTYCAYWDRISRLIEMGTYDKDRTRNPMADHPVLRRRAARVLGPKERRALRNAEKTQREGKGKPEAAKATTPNEADQTFGRSNEDRKLRTLYMDYVRARKTTGEALEGLSYRNFKNTVLKTRHKQIDRLACKDVLFRVEIRSGRASLIAQPVRNADEEPRTHEETEP